MEDGTHSGIGFDDVRLKKVLAAEVMGVGDFAQFAWHGPKLGLASSLFKILTTEDLGPSPCLASVKRQLSKPAPNLWPAASNQSASSHLVLRMSLTVNHTRADN